MNSKIESLLFSYLLKDNSLKVIFSDCELKEITKISWRYLLPGFILEKNNAENLGTDLTNQLKDQQTIFLSKYLTGKHDLLTIAKLFKEKNIEFTVMKGMALTIGNIYKPGIRGSRDIDILINKQEIGSAYKALRSIGFRYENPKTHDNANFLYGYHLPPMENKIGTSIEIHWQATKLYNSSHCPLTKEIISGRKELNHHPNIFIPDIGSMMTHALYHGLQHHKLDQGPIFLFDMAALYHANNKIWPDNEKLMAELNLLRHFKN